MTGERVYSVTTIIDRGIPKQLANWAAKQAAQYAVDHWDELNDMGYQTRLDLIATAHDRVREEAASKGDEVHVSVDNHLKGKPDGKSLSHLRQLDSFLEVSGFKPVFQEVTIWNRTMGYAGTADLIAADQHGRHYLIDYKTGRGIWPEHAIQVEALARGEFIINDDGTETPKPIIHEVGVLHLRPKSWWYHPVADSDAVDSNWQVFLAAKQISEWKRFHPAMVWGTTERYNADNWQALAA